MKKVFVMLLAAAMVFSMIACGQEMAGPSKTGASVETDDIEPSVQFDPSATIAETVLVDESDVKITVTDLKYTAYSVKLSLTIENNSNLNLSFYAGTLGYNCNSVNGYMVSSGYLNSDVSAGKKANETISIDAEELTLLGLTDIADIELGFRITNDLDEYLLTGPRQLKTTAADGYDYSEDTYRRAITDKGVLRSLDFTLDYDSEETVYDKKGIQVLSQTLVYNTDNEPFLLVEVMNTTSDTIYTVMGDVSLNGLSVQSGAWTSDSVNSGARRIVAMNLSSMLEEEYWSVFGLDEIGEITYSLEIKDTDWDTLIVPQPLSFTVPSRAVSYDRSGNELYQADGLRIIFKQLMADPSDYSDDVHVLLLIENNASEEYSFDVDYDSVSVNGYMTDFICYSKQAAPGGCTILDVELDEDDLESNGIGSPEDITEVEMSIEIKDRNYKTVGKPTVTITIK